MRELGKGFDTLAGLVAFKKMHRAGFSHPKTVTPVRHSNHDYRFRVVQNASQQVCVASP